MRNVEFYITPRGGIKITDGHGTHELTQENREFIAAALGKIGDFWPDDLESLSKEYSSSRHNIPLFEFLMVRRFLKCNFPKYDSTMDIDHLGNFNFEEPECPMKGECRHEGVICRPKFNSRLSDREIEVMKLYYENLDESDISDRLYISKDTVRTHKRNAFQRTKVHSLGEFILYAKNNNLFK